MQSHKSEAVSEGNNESLGEIDVNGRKSRKHRSQIIPYSVQRYGLAKTVIHFSVISRNEAGVMHLPGIMFVHTSY